MSYVISILAILVAVSWLCLSLPTPAEQYNRIDKIGKTTGRNWR
jgi:hypothetical protein